MFGVFKNLVVNRWAYSALVLLILGSCDMSMGLGPPIDLEPSTVILTHITLPDGKRIDIHEDDNKLFIGPAIQQGAGATLHGRAWDNVLVTEVRAEEIGSHVQLPAPTWITRNLGARSADGWQNWSILLDGLQEGERTITITSLDFPGNIGPNNVKFLSLLIGTDPEFADVKIERQPGLLVELLPLVNNKDPYKFDDIDFFQNEQFKIRANITHEYSLTDVRLNLLDGDQPVFASPLARTGGSEFTPEWDITHAMLTGVDSKYAQGEHYLRVSISAKAEAGHTGEFDTITNNYFNVIWRPESDIPRIQLQGSDAVNKDGMVAVRVFHDDNIGALYRGFVPVSVWNDMPGSDEDKLLWLHDGSNRNSFAYKHNNGLDENILASTVRNTIIAVDAKVERGEYKLVVISSDVKINGAAQVFGGAALDITVIEVGFPIISVISPADNSAAKLTADMKLNIQGHVTNIDPVNELWIAWIPYGLGDAEHQIRLGEAALESRQTGTKINGIKVWDISLAAPFGFSVGEKVFQRRPFTISLDYFEEFDGFLDKEKFFMLYAIQNNGEPSFKNLRVMPITHLPTITVSTRRDEGDPFDYANWQRVGADQTIYFRIRAESDAGVPVNMPTMTRREGNKPLTLTAGAQPNTWYAEDEFSDVGEGDYSYIIEAEDWLGNESIPREVNIRVTTLPSLQEINSTNNMSALASTNTHFAAGDKIYLQAVFGNAVHVLTTETAKPRIRLEGFTDNLPRYAYYTDGSDSTVIIFEYTVGSGDKTLDSGLTAAAIEENGSVVNANGFEGANAVLDLAYLADDKKLPAKRFLFVDGVPPVITDITISGTKGTGWHTEGDNLTVNVTFNKEIRVLGSPKLNLNFINGVKQAEFQTTSGVSTLVFVYKVDALDAAEPVGFIRTSAFSNDDRQMITDKVGSLGNIISLGGTAALGSVINVDAVPPAALAVVRLENLDTPTSRTFRIGNPLAIEAGAAVEYTETGVTWLPFDNPGSGTFTVTNSGNENTYNVAVRQVDRAGNIGEEGAAPQFTLGGTTNLTSVISLTPDGAYVAGSQLRFRLIFSGRVYTTGSPSIRINDTITIPVTPVIKQNSDLVLDANWTVTAGHLFDPVTLTGITLTGIIREIDDQPVTTNVAPYLTGGASGFSRPGLRVMSRNPTITGGSLISSGSPLNPVITPNGSRSVITLVFSQNVFPENGFIRVRPTGTAGTTTNGQWLVPPVLTNEEFTQISSALSEAQRERLTTTTGFSSRYIRTTHGITPSAGRYVPDISTKYVLDFASDLNNANIRGLLDEARFLRQEIEAVNTAQVTGSGGASISSSTGTNTVEIHLDALPPGRQWKVEIDTGAFRDAAGNQFINTDGWGSANSTRWFWSQQTATPVIRVERVSNNRARNTPALIANTAAVFQTNVRYRIDCVTPDAVITYGEWNRSASVPAANAAIGVLRGVNGGIARIGDTAAMASNFSSYISNSNDGLQNSDIADATVAEIETTLRNAITTNYSGTRTVGGMAIDDTSNAALYTARKDYIGAIARRSGLADSAPGYEGAFKTVIVMRNFTGAGDTLVDNSTNFLKLEATNTRNGAVTIAGFPMSYNDASGQGSRFFFRDAALTGTDFIWISWEMVSNFWHVSLRMPSDLPSGTLTHNAWVWQPEWYAHNFRKYGNWGLRDGNR